MNEDDHLARAHAHWAHRFVSRGVALADFLEVTAGITSWDQWCAAWSDRAAVHVTLGELAEARGHMRTAAEHFTRAGLYYHFAKYMFVVDVAAMRAAHRHAVACRNRALAHLSPPGERVLISYEGTTLPANLRLPADRADAAPVVVMVMGLDSAKEEMDTFESTFLARGMATLCVDGPGQGESEYDLPVRGDYEVPAGAVLDWVAQDRRLDRDRIGIWGISLGGYYAPRAAAFDRRIKACVALGGPYDLGAAWEGLPELTREVFRTRAHKATQAEAAAHARSFTLEGVADDIGCPLLVVFGRKDRLFHYQDAERLVAEASGPAELWMIEAGAHVANNRMYEHRSQVADWLADRLVRAPA